MIKNFVCNIWTVVEYVRLLSKYTKDGAYKNPKKLMAYSDKQIYKVMKRAYTIPIYRKKFDTINLLPEDFKCRKDLLKFPILTKMELREWMNTELENVNTESLFINCTSGSSGMPLSMLYSVHDKAVANANWMRLLKIHGYNPFKDCTMAIKVNTKMRGNAGDSLVQKLGICRRYTYSALMDISELANALNEKKPTLLYANKSILVRLILYAYKEHIELYKPRLICSTSELLDVTSRKLITEYFGDVLFESYGAEEVSAFTYTQCDNPEKHYITWDTHTFFTRKPDGNLSLMESGDIIVTSLFQKKYPVINYELKDSVELFQDGTMPYIKKICGRRTDWFIFEDGDRLGFQPFYHIAEICPYCYQMRFIQLDYHHIKIQLVKNGVDATKVQIEQYIEEKLDNLIKKDNIIYIFEWMSEIPLDSNNKIKFMISNIAQSKNMD
jgi:phenylacetate-coenzyme A ligase PaaK-like adenylate-forming protein